MLQRRRDARAHAGNRRVLVAEHRHHVDRGVERISEQVEPGREDRCMARAGRADEEPQAWGVGKRQVTPHDPFPFGGGFLDD